MLPGGPLTCEAHGAFEGAAHALEAVLNEVTEELGWGVEHLVAQFTLVVDAFLCKETVASQRPARLVLRQLPTAPPQSAEPGLLWGPRTPMPSPQPQMVQPPEAYRLQGVGPTYLALESIICCDLSCWSSDKLCHMEWAPGWGLHREGNPSRMFQKPVEYLQSVYYVPGT